MKAKETPSPTALGDVLIYGKKKRESQMVFHGNRMGSGGDWNLPSPVVTMKINMRNGNLIGF